MTDYIEVDIGTLEKDVSEMSDKLEQVRKDMEQMFQSVQQLDTMWDGMANMAFNVQFANDRQMFDELAMSVEGIIDSMNNAIISYRKCEAEVSSQIDSIKIG